MNPLKGIRELVRGLQIAGKHLGRHAITIQYPEERWTMPERSRGIVVLLSDKETGELNCTACMLCEKACPTAAIRIDAPRDEKKKRHLKQFIVDHGLCCFCGLCEEACNFSAIKMATKYEFSSESKDDLVWDIKKLQEVGRDVPYIDTRKKKKEAAKEKVSKTAPPKPEKAEQEKPDAPTESKGVETPPVQAPTDSPEQAKEKPAESEQEMPNQTPEDKDKTAAPEGPKPSDQQKDEGKQDDKQGQS
jgi:NADH-quinone oxidoreductase subunit I